MHTRSNYTSSRVNNDDEPGLGGAEIILMIFLVYCAFAMAPFAKKAKRR